MAQAIAIAQRCAISNACDFGILTAARTPRRCVPIGSAVSWLILGALFSQKLDGDIAPGTHERPEWPPANVMLRGTHDEEHRLLAPVLSSPADPDHLCEVVAARFDVVGRMKLPLADVEDALLGLPSLAERLAQTAYAAHEPRASAFRICRRWRCLTDKRHGEVVRVVPDQDAARFN